MEDEWGLMGFAWFNEVTIKKMMIGWECKGNTIYNLWYANIAMENHHVV